MWTEVRLYYTARCFTAHSERVLPRLRQAARVLMLREMDFRLTRLDFASVARIRNLAEIDAVPVDIQITPHNSTQQIILLGWGC